MQKGCSKVGYQPETRGNFTPGSGDDSIMEGRVMTRPSMIFAFSSHL